MSETAIQYPVSEKTTAKPANRDLDQRIADGFFPSGGNFPMGQDHCPPHGLASVLREIPKGGHARLQRISQKHSSDCF